MIYVFQLVLTPPVTSTRYGSPDTGRLVFVWYFVANHPSSALRVVAVGSITFFVIENRCCDCVVFTVNPPSRLCTVSGACQNAAGLPTLSHLKALRCECRSVHVFDLSRTGQHTHTPEQWTNTGTTPPVAPTVMRSMHKQLMIIPFRRWPCKNCE